MPPTVVRFFFAGLLAAGLLSGQRPTEAPAKDRSSAYYNYALGHLYAELAGGYGFRSEYVNRAIEHLKRALKDDPEATFVTEELAELYMQAGRLSDAVTELEASLRANPDDLNARRILGRIYMRLIGDRRQSEGVNEEMLKKAIEQYQKIAEKQPGESDTWLMLGRLYKAGQNLVDAEKAYRKVLEAEPDNEDAMTGLALVYSDLGDHNRAAELLQKVTGRSPNLRNLMTLASAYEQMRDYKLAAQTLKRAVDLQPGNTDLKRALAQDLMLAEQLEDALKLYQELVAEDPRDFQSYLRISQIYREQHKYAEAREANRKAREIEPDNLEIQYNEVNVLEAEGKYAEAIAQLREILTSTAKRTYSQNEKTSRAQLLERLGLLYRSSEKFDKAVETFRSIAELDPRLGARAAAQVMDCYRAAKNWKQALAEAEEARKNYPDDRLVKVVRASILADAGRTSEAIAETLALLDGKNDRETWLTLAQLYDKAKNYAEMEKAIDSAEKLSKSQEEKEAIYFTRGAMLEKQKKYDAAEAEFRRVLGINPSSASALNYLGYMLADRGVRLSEAVEMIQKALEIEPTNGAYLDSLGWAYYRLGRYEEAETYLRRALERISRDPTIHDHLGDVYAKLGKLKEAVAAWSAALKEWETSAASEVDPDEVAKVQKKLESAKVRLAKESSATKN